MTPLSFKRHRFPPTIIRHAVWLYARFTLSYRDIEEMLAERGVDVSYETVRSWFLKFGPGIAANLRRPCSRPSDCWHLDEMVVRINGKTHYDRGLRANNRAENSHLPIRRRERKEKGFKTAGSAQSASSPSTLRPTTPSTINATLRTEPTTSSFETVLSRRGRGRWEPPEPASAPQSLDRTR